MDISKEMYIWIDTIFRKEENGGIVLDGSSFDDELGFGAEKRGYKGEFIQISKDGRIVDFGEISMIHYFRFGLKWIVQSTGSFLKLPFLITDNLEMKHIYSGEVRLHPSHSAEIAIKKYRENSFAVVSEFCIGNLLVHGESMYMDVFSDKKNIGSMEFLTEHFCFAGYDDCIGSLELCL